MGLTPSLKTRGGGAGSLTVGPRGPLVRFDQSPLPPFPLPERRRDSTIAIDERRFPVGFWGRGWIRQSRAVLPVV